MKRTIIVAFCLVLLASFASKALAVEIWVDSNPGSYKPFADGVAYNVDLTKAIGKTGSGSYIFSIEFAPYDTTGVWEPAGAYGQDFFYLQMQLRSGSDEVISEALYSDVFGSHNTFTKTLEFHFNGEPNYFLSVFSDVSYPEGEYWELKNASISTAPTPLPAAALLLGSGLIGFIELRRRAS